MCVCVNVCVCLMSDQFFNPNLFFPRSRHGHGYILYLIAYIDCPLLSPAQVSPDEVETQLEALVENFQVDEEPPALDTDQVMHVDGQRRQAEKDPGILKAFVSDPYHASTRKLS